MRKKSARRFLAAGALLAGLLMPGVNARAEMNPEIRALKDAMETQVKESGQTDGDIILPLSDEHAAQPDDHGAAAHDGGMAVGLLDRIHSQRPTDTKNGAQWGTRLWLEVYDSDLKYNVSGTLKMQTKDSATGQITTRKTIPFSKTGTSSSQFLTSYDYIIYNGPNLKGKGVPDSTELLVGEVTGPTTYHVISDANAYGEYGYIRDLVEGKWSGTSTTTNKYMPESDFSYIIQLDDSGKIAYQDVTAPTADGFAPIKFWDAIETGYIRIDNSSANTAVTAATKTTDCADGIKNGVHRPLGRYDNMDDSGNLHASGTITSGAFYADYTTVDYTVADALKYIHVTYYTQAGNSVTKTIQVPAAVQIKYDSQGGSAVTPSSKTFAGYNHTVTSQVPTRAGYQFLGWYTAANGGGTKQNAGASMKLTSDVTLYAAWKANYKITTSVTGGTIDPSVTGLEPGSSKTINYKPEGTNLLESVTVNGNPVDKTKYASSYTFSNIQGDQTISVVYRKKPALAVKKTASPAAVRPDGTIRYTIEVTQTVAGTYAQDVRITDTLPSGLKIKGLPTGTAVKADSSTVTVNSTSTTENAFTATVPGKLGTEVTKVTLTFDAVPDGKVLGKITNTATASSTDAGTAEGSADVNVEGWKITTSITGGTIDPSIGNLKTGESRTIKYSPDKGNYVKSVTVDGTKLGTAQLKAALSQYAFNNISGDHSITVECAKIPQVTISKKLLDQEGHPYVEAKGSPEFSFKIYGTNYLGETKEFYLHLSAKGGQASGTLTIPAGTWNIAELHSDGWKLSAVEPGANCTKTETGASVDTRNADNASVTFGNAVDGYSRYTDNGVKVNRLKK